MNSFIVDSFNANLSLQSSQPGYISFFYFFYVFFLLKLLELSFKREKNPFQKRINSAAKTNYLN